MFESTRAAIDVDLCFQDFAAELDRLSVMYAPPPGALLLAKAGSEVAGCAGLRKLRDDISEMKRLTYARSFGATIWADGWRRKSRARARELGYRTLVLDTLGTMEAPSASTIPWGSNRHVVLRQSRFPT
jgi:hypothetical protein